MKRKLHNIFAKRRSSSPKPSIPKHAQKIIIDYREKNSLVASELVKQGFVPEFKQLELGDYIIGDIVIERKTVNDFVSSLLNKRLTRQLENLQTLPKKLMLIEGVESQELYNSNYDGTGIHPNALRGMLLTITLYYGVPLLTTNNAEDTATFLSLLAKKQNKEISLNAKRKPRSANEQLQYLVEGFPRIGPTSAKKLLKEFKTLKNFINASEEQLVELLGKKGSDLFFWMEKRYTEK